MAVRLKMASFGGAVELFSDTWLLFRIFLQAFAAFP